MPELETILSILMPTLASIASLAYWLGRRFEAIDGKFEEVDRRFGEMEKRFEAMDDKFEKLRGDMRASFEGLKNAVLAVNSMLVEFMGLKEFFTPKESRFLMSEANRLLSSVKLPTNPLTKE